MSILQKKLRNIIRATGPEIGFRKASGEKRKRQMLVIADVSGQDKKKIEAIAASGVDAVFADLQTIKANSVSLNDIPFGIKTGVPDASDIEQIAAAAYDFTVSNLDTPVEVSGNEDTGKLLIVESDLSPNLVRTINNLGVSLDAVILADHHMSVSFSRLLVCQLFTDLLHRPLLVTAAPGLSSAELSSLCQSGVKGVVLDKSTPAEEYSGIVTMIENLPPAAKKKDRQDAILPSLGVVRERHEEEEDDEEDD